MVPSCCSQILTCVNTFFNNLLWCFEFSLLEYNYLQLRYNFQSLGYNYQIKGHHWGITTSLVVIPQSDPLNLLHIGIQLTIQAAIHVAHYS